MSKLRFILVLFGLWVAGLLIQWVFFELIPSDSAVGRALEVDDVNVYVKAFFNALFALLVAYGITRRIFDKEDKEEE